MYKNNKLFPILAAVLVLLLGGGCNSLPTGAGSASETLSIYPDYTAVVIPPNVAPMNFQVENEGDDFVVEVRNSKGRSIRVKHSEGKIIFSGKAWRRLLEEDRGGSLEISVFRKKAKDWEAFPVVVNGIAEEDIDPFIVFRKIPPANILWKEMGIYQRSTENFKEYPIMVNSLTDNNCMNCHTFNGGDPDQMIFHMRTVYGGTYITKDGDARFVNTNNENTRSAGAYPSWHPNGEIIAFSVNLIRQSFHSSMDMGNHSYVFDKYSDIILYDVDNNSVTRPAELASDKLENLPVWSVDGSHMYYLCADQHVDTILYSKRKYNLMDIEFDPESRKFGMADTLIDARRFGRSVTFPRENPRQDLLSFVGVDYGYFSIYNEDADVYFLDLGNGQITKPEINSDLTESYPSWSVNGSWLMFVSKRGDGYLSQPFFCYVDAEGHASKPFVLPQEDPAFYKEYLYNYNRPEFVSGKVDLKPRNIFSMVKKIQPEQSTFNEEASVSAASGATAPASAGENHHYNFD